VPGTSPRRYNILVPASAPRRQPDPPPSGHHHAPQVYTLETTGLLIIAVLVLVLFVIRYWHNIAWSAR